MSAEEQIVKGATEVAKKVAQSEMSEWVMSNAMSLASSVMHTRSHMVATQIQMIGLVTTTALISLTAMYVTDQAVKITRIKAEAGAYSQK